MLISKAEYARHRGVSKPAVTQAIKSGRIKETQGKIDREQADRDWESNSDKRQQRKPKTVAIAVMAAHTAGSPSAESEPPEVGDGDFAEAQRQNEWEKVWKQRLARKVAEGKLLDVDEVRREWEQHRDTIKNRLLLLESKVPPEARAAVGREVRSLLHGLADDESNAA